MSPGDVVPDADRELDRQLDLVAVLADARNGRSAALGRLVAEYTPVLWNVARQQGLDRTTSEDVVQTAWLRLLRDPQSIRTPQALLAWLITVTRRDAWRVAGAGRREEVSDDLVDLVGAERETPEQAVLAREQESLLWAAVGQLPPRCQELLRIVAFAARPDYSVVAQALGMPVGSIGPTRGRCLAKLRTLLGQDQQWSTS
jgi:RNA polymerase sigma factor (sigma-70 family)